MSAEDLREAIEIVRTLAGEQGERGAFALRMVAKAAERLLVGSD